MANELTWHDLEKLAKIAAKYPSPVDLASEMNRSRVVIPEAQLARGTWRAPGPSGNPHLLQRFTKRSNHDHRSFPCYDNCVVPTPHYLPWSALLSFLGQVKL